MRKEPLVCWHGEIPILTVIQNDLTIHCCHKNSRDPHANKLQKAIGYIHVMAS